MQIISDTLRRLEDLKSQYDSRSDYYSMYKDGRNKMRTNTVVYTESTKD